MAAELNSGLTIGVIGAGRMGQIRAAALAAHPAVSKVVIHDAVAGAEAALANRIGATRAGSAGELLSEVDGVLICTTASTHAALVGQAARYAIPIFCEKPLASDLAAARGLIERLGDAGARVQVGFQRRCDPQYAALRAGVAAGDYGRLLTIRTTAFDSVPPPPAFLPGSGGIFADLVIHDFDAVRWLSGQDITRVYASGSRLTGDHYADCGDYDVASVLCLLRDGAQAVISASRNNAYGYDHRLELLGTGGSVAIGLSEQTPLRRSPDAPVPSGAYVSFVDRFASAYDMEIDGFVARCLGLGPNVCPIEDAWEAMLAVEAARRSATEGRPITLEEVAS